MIGNLKVPTIFTAVDKVSKVVDGMQKKTTGFQKSLNKMANYGAAAGLGVLSYFAVATNEAIKFEDKLADIAKTTGLSGKPLEQYGESLLKIATRSRSSIAELQEIGIVAGQLGIHAKDLASFTEQANKFAVALGGDYSGGVNAAINSVGKLNVLFKDTKNLNPAESLKIAGSMINELTNMGVKAENINDFALRVGRLPDVFKPSLKSTLALGATFEKLGVNSEIASSGFNNLILTAAKNMPEFAKRMGMSALEAERLLQLDPVKFASKFAKSFKNMSPAKLATELAKLKINSNEVVGVVGGLAAGSDILTEALARTNEQYQKATSLTMEYDTKNSTMAAKIAIAKNNFEVMSIIIGTQLLPILGELIGKIMPIVESVIEWVKVNKDLIPIIAYVAAGLIGLKFALAAYTTITSAAAIAQGFFAATIGATLLPITLIIGAIVAIIAMIVYWDDICAWFSKQWSRFTNWISELWQKMVKGFQEFDFMNFFKGIGNSVIEFLLKPMELIFVLLSKLPGKMGEVGKQSLGILDSLRFDVNQNTTAQLSPNTTAQVATNESISTNNSRVQVDFNDPKNKIGGIKQFGQVTPVLVNGMKFSE